jgi:hypothetical protein
MRVRPVPSQAVQVDTCVEAAIMRSFWQIILGLNKLAIRLRIRNN